MIITPNPDEITQGRRSSEEDALACARRTSKIAEALSPDFTVATTDRERGRRAGELSVVESLGHDGDARLGAVTAPMGPGPYDDYTEGYQEGRAATEELFRGKGAKPGEGGY